MSRSKVAVVGSGVAGLTAAWVISKSADVTLFEADERLGGHADTHDVRLNGKNVAVDTGFIVHNDRTYPVLRRLLDELDVTTRQSEMSLSVRDDATGVQWAGAMGVRGLFPMPRLLVRPAHLRMLLEIPRFHRQAKRLLASTTPDPAYSAQTLEDFLSEGGYSSYFRRHFMEPLVAAVWSCDPAVAVEYPAAYLFTFLHHHGMLRVFGSPRWRTIVGGSRTYVEQIASGVYDVRAGTKITTVVEEDGGAVVTDGNGATARFDAVVIATHPGQALDLLGRPTAAQHEVLSSLEYSANEALLHSDDSLLPTAPRARAAWNFLRRSGEGTGGLTVTYDLSRLQGLDTGQPLLLTLGGSEFVDPELVLERMEYEHPLYTPASVAAQARLPEINTPRLAFAGAYHGWGFHEDGARSGLAAAEHLGYSWGPRAGVFRTTVRHTRRTPFHRSFEHHAHFWVVDVDALPDHGRTAFVRGSFQARDHMGEPSRTIRENVEDFLRASGDPTPGQILMAAQPRAWGYCFNPISVFWCFDPLGSLAATIVEVHNTYGDRHAYLVHTEPDGRADVDKAMYVSPFHGTDGTYTVVAPVPGDQLKISITLHTDDGATFSASLVGTRADGEVRRAAVASLRSAFLIRAHGIWLWLRRLPVEPRPPYHQQGAHR